MTVHNFNKSWKKSKEQAKKPIWNDLLQHFWPGCKRKDYEDDLHMQKSGVDAIIMHKNKPIWIDFKHRPSKGGRPYFDILLEYWSDKGNRIPGWAVKDDKTDYYLYLNETNDTCQKIPAKTVRLAMQKYLEEWKADPSCFISEANNGQYVTFGICVPKIIVDEACKEFGEGIEDINLSVLDKKVEVLKVKSAKKKIKDIFDY